MTYRCFSGRRSLCIPPGGSSCRCRCWGRCGAAPLWTGSWHPGTECWIRQQPPHRECSPNDWNEDKLVGTDIIYNGTRESGMSAVWGSPLRLHQEHGGVGSVLSFGPGAVEGAWVVWCWAADVTWRSRDTFSFCLCWMSQLLHINESLLD